MQRNTRLVISVSLILGALVVSGCTADIRKSGYYPLEQELDVIQVGQSTRAQVLGAIGSPSIGSGADDQELYYVGQQARYFGPFKPQLVDRQIVVVSFDSADRVKNVQVLGLEDGQVVVLSQRVTETIAGDFGFFQQLFGNVGNFDASQLIGS
jgi:outer membrane protein assembly factor BamE (lipoprotein component of BamABCDE complex)